MTSLVSPLEYRPMVWIGAMSGLRWGEMAALRVKRVDVLRSTVYVAETITRGKKGERHFGPPKSEAGVPYARHPGRAR